MKNLSKIIFWMMLFFLLVGILMGSVAASHTFKDKGYKYTMGSAELKKMKKVAKRDGIELKDKHVSKVKNKYSYEKLKVGKKYKMMGTDEKFKVLSLNKIIKGKGVGDGGYIYKVRQYGRMTCQIDYYKGKFVYSAWAS